VASAQPELWPWQENRHETPPDARSFGLRIFFISLSVLFLSSLIAVGAVRARVPVPDVRVEFPPIGWVSTGVLALLSLAMHVGVRALRGDRKRLFQGSMVVALACGTAFVSLQSALWARLFDQELAVTSAVESGMYAYLMLTALHAAHVAGGVILQGLVTFRALRNDYWSLHLGPVRGCAAYWHFIDAVWAVLLAFLLLIR
jgi:cytochrome c oxidase subunit 3